jgi:hypothetical protein
MNVHVKRNLFGILVVLATVLSSCYRDIDMEKQRPEADLVLNGVISADTAVMLSISRTKFFTDTSPYEVVTDAGVSLSVNGLFREQMQWTADESFYGGGIYISGYEPKAGDRIRIEAATKYGDAWVEETIPAGVAIEDVTLSHRLIYDHKGHGLDENGDLVEIPTLEITYQITFTDKAETADFYFIRIDNPNPPFTNLGNLDYSLEPVFVEQVSVVDGLFGDKTIQGQGGRAFTDHLLNGQRYTLVIRETQSSSYDRRILLYAVTESYYNYLTSMQMSTDAENSTNLSTFGFTEPIRIFSNIHGGVGIMATSQHDSFPINLKTILSNDSLQEK